MITGGPDVLFPGRILIIAPHMDDELLGCGATIARVTDKSKVFVSYATDGAASPVPHPGWGEEICRKLPELRRAEATVAMGVIGVPAANLRFLDLDDGTLAGRVPELGARIREVAAEVRPDHVLVPFRFDRHPDHLAVNSAARAADSDGALGAELFEYFVYSRMRLLRRGDLRAYIRPEILIRVEPDGVSDRKRLALECNRTQVTRYFDWQLRPILTASLLDDNCSGPEVFLRSGLVGSDDEIFVVPLWLIQLAHTLEPRLKRWKDRGKERLARWRRSTGDGRR
jgi:LmbE family N-acetylglucosaminyl deacetylase